MLTDGRAQKQNVCVSYKIDSVLNRLTIAISLTVACTIIAAGQGRFRLGNPPPIVVVDISPRSVTLNAKDKQLFTATVSGATNSVIWTLNPPGIGTLSRDGQYTAPAQVSSEQIVKAIASSNVDPKKTAEATITLKRDPGPNVIITVLWMATVLTCLVSVVEVSTKSKTRFACVLTLAYLPYLLLLLVGNLLAALSAWFFLREKVGAAMMSLQSYNLK